MLVGAGGNAGNQAAVRVIRGIAVGSVNQKTQWQVLCRELRMATALSMMVGFAGFFRAYFSLNTTYAEIAAITSALFTIVFISVILGAILPLLLQQLQVDPAHSSTTIQVIMDILGVLITCTMATIVLRLTT